MDSKNPIFKRAMEQTRDIATTEVMTVVGSINKTGILTCLLIIGAVLSWQDASNQSVSALPTILGLLVGTISCIVILFRPTTAPWLSPVYALSEGLLIGGISKMYDSLYPGIAVNAVALTFATLGGILVLYRLGVLRATERFRRVLMVAMFAILAVYVVDLVMMFFSSNVPFLHQASPMGIVVSLVITGVAALNLVLDFDFIEKGANAKYPKFMEWYAGFGLLVTLVWLYMEILRLLSKLNRR